MFIVRHGKNSNFFNSWIGNMILQTCYSPRPHSLALINAVLIQVSGIIMEEEKALKLFDIMLYLSGVLTERKGLEKK